MSRRIAVGPERRRRGAVRPPVGKKNIAVFYLAIHSAAPDIFGLSSHGSFIPRFAWGSIDVSTCVDMSPQAPTRSSSSCRRALSLFRRFPVPSGYFSNPVAKVSSTALRCSPRRSWLVILHDDFFPLECNEIFEFKREMIREMRA